MTPEQEKSATRLYWKIKEIQRFLEYKPDMEKERILCVNEISSLLKEERARIITTLETVVPRGEHTPDIVNNWIIPELKRRLTPDTNQTEV